MRLKIGTYNICHCCDFTKFAPTYERDNHVVNIEQIANIIKSLDLDIVGLNEVFEDGTENFEDYKHQTEKLAKLANYPYFYYAQGHNWNFTDIGNAILSKHPIENIQTFNIPTLPENERTEKVWHESRVIIFATININNTKVNTIITHFGMASVELERITKKTCELIDSSSLPVIMMGDLNVSPNSYYLDGIYSRLNSCAKLANNANCTCPSWSPNVQIDYIFIPKSTKLINYQTHDILASDHIPISATIEL